MGEVYRAKDTRLGRHVALKFLPAQVASDSDRIARFQREAQVLASLNHPYIAAIYGFEEADGVRALVLELVEGETLGDRIARGPIPVDDALPIATQIAEALEAAHEQGIIHRDLKPANIKVNADGRVKVLDFGLAKLAEPPAAATIDSSARSMSPTITTPAMTQMGLILGTAAYMSPEQARGRPVDARADVWAFGCVLFEMLTATRAFDGTDVVETLGAVVHKQVDWSALPSTLPPHLRAVLHNCLEKDPRRRLRNMGDVQLALERTFALAGDRDPESPKIPSWALFAAGGALLLAGGAVGVALGVGLLPGLDRGGQVTAAVARFRVQLPDAIANTTVLQLRQFAVSPDGQTIVRAARLAGAETPVLFRRRLDSVSFEPIRGSDGATAPFFSPDGQWIGFVSQRVLKVVPTDGGLPRTVAALAEIRDRFGRGAWGDDGTIVINIGSSLYEVPAAGGTWQLLLKGEANAGFSEPQFLPGSEALLVQTAGEGGEPRVEIVDRRTKSRHPLLSGTSPQLGGDDLLMFEQQGQIWAVGFDAKRRKTMGPPVPVVESTRNRAVGGAFSVSQSSLVYISGAVTTRSIVWIDRDGKLRPAIEIRAGFQSPRLSPDGNSIAVSVGEANDIDIWTYDLQRGTRLRLTTGGRNRRSVWSPDGKQIAFYSVDESSPPEQDIFVVPASRESQPRRLFSRPGPQFPDVWTRDGQSIVFADGEGGTGVRRDLWLYPLNGAAKPLVVTRFNERGATLSPDGQWMAFVSDESGLDEVYVQPFPGPGAKTPISTRGGLQPAWSRDGRELFYRERDSLMSVRVAFSPLSASVPTRLFEMPAAVYNLDPNFADYDVAPDGRFIAIRGEDRPNDEINVVLNWREDVRRALNAASR